MSDKDDAGVLITEGPFERTSQKAFERIVELKVEIERLELGHATMIEWRDALANATIVLRTKLAEARELLVRTHWCRDEASCEVCRWLAANREGKP